MHTVRHGRERERERGRNESVFNPDSVPYNFMDYNAAQCVRKGDTLSHKIILENGESNKLATAPAAAAEEEEGKNQQQQNICEMQMSSIQYFVSKGKQPSTLTHTAHAHFDRSQRSLYAHINVIAIFICQFTTAVLSSFLFPFPF